MKENAGLPLAQVVILLSFVIGDWFDWQERV